MEWKYKVTNNGKKLKIVLKYDGLLTSFLLQMWITSKYRPRKKCIGPFHPAHKPVKQQVDIFAPSFMCPCFLGYKLIMLPAQVDGCVMSLVAERVVSTLGTGVMWGGCVVPGGLRLFDPTVCSYCAVFFLKIESVLL